MRKRVAITTAAVAVIAAVAIPMSASGAAQISTSMTGAQVVNPNGGDPNGSAKLKLRINRVKQRLCFKLTTSGLSKVTGAFIHKGAPGQIARPIITLFNTSETASTIKGCEHNIRSRLIRRLKRKPGQHYADVTTKGYPDGAVRGQFG